MSVIVDISIFPVDKQDSVSPYVARAVNIIKSSGLSHQLGPMGTCIEGSWADVMAVADQCFQELKKDCDRIYMTMKVDYRKGKDGRLSEKVTSVEEKIAK